MAQEQDMIRQWDNSSDMTIGRQVLADGSLLFVGASSAFRRFAPQLPCRLGIEHEVPPDYEVAVYSFFRADMGRQRILQQAQVGVGVSLTQKGQVGWTRNWATLLSLCGEANEEMPFFLDAIVSGTKEVLGKTVEQLGVRFIAINADFDLFRSRLGFEFASPALATSWSKDPQLVVNANDPLVLIRTTSKVPATSVPTATTQAPRQEQQLQSKPVSPDVGTRSSPLQPWQPPQPLQPLQPAQPQQRLQPLQRPQPLQQPQQPPMPQQPSQASKLASALLHFTQSMRFQEFHLMWTHQTLPQGLRVMLSGSNGCEQFTSIPVGSLTIVLLDSSKTQSLAFAETDVNRRTLTIYSLCGLRSRVSTLFKALDLMIPDRFPQVTEMSISDVPQSSEDFFHDSLGFERSNQDSNVMIRFVGERVVQTEVAPKALPSFPGLPSLPSVPSIRRPDATLSNLEARAEFFRDVQVLGAAVTIPAAASALQLVMDSQRSEHTEQMAAMGVALLKLSQDLSETPEDPVPACQTFHVGSKSSKRSTTRVSLPLAVQGKILRLCYQADEFEIARTSDVIPNPASGQFRQIEGNFKLDILGLFLEAQRLAPYQVVDDNSIGLPLFKEWIFPVLWKYSRANLSLAPDEQKPTWRILQQEQTIAFENKFWHVLGHSVMTTVRTLLCLVLTGTRLTVDLWTTLAGQVDPVSVDYAYKKFVFEAVTKFIEPTRLVSRSNIDLFNADSGNGIRRGLEHTIGQLVNLAKRGLDSFAPNAIAESQKAFAVDSSFRRYLAQNLVKGRVGMFETTCFGAAFFAVALDLLDRFADATQTEAKAAFIMQWLKGVLNDYENVEPPSVAGGLMGVVSKLQEPQYRRLLNAVLVCFAQDASICGIAFLDKRARFDGFCCATISAPHTYPAAKESPMSLSMSLGPLDQPYQPYDQPYDLESLRAPRHEPLPLPMPKPIPQPFPNPLPKPLPFATLPPMPVPKPVIVEPLKPWNPPPAWNPPPPILVSETKPSPRKPFIAPPLRPEVAPQRQKQAININVEFPGLEKYKPPKKAEEKPVEPPETNPTDTGNPVLEQIKTAARERQELLIEEETERLRLAEEVRANRVPRQAMPVPQPLPPPVMPEKQPGWFDFGIARAVKGWFSRKLLLLDPRVVDVRQKNITKADDVNIHLMSYKNTDPTALEIYRSIEQEPHVRSLWGVNLDDITKRWPKAVEEKGPLRVKFLLIGKLPGQLQATLIRLNKLK